MQTKKLTGGQEFLCINTEKVYDWVLNDAVFDLKRDGIQLPVIDGTRLECDTFDPAKVFCEVEPDLDPMGRPKFDILSRVDQEFIIDGAPVTLQIVNIRKHFTVYFYYATNGTPIQLDYKEYKRCEQVILCAPGETTINLTYTNLDCSICVVDCDTTGRDSIDVEFTVRLCQSIQSVYDVTLEIVADFCEPRDVLPIPPTPCSTPVIPPQCPVIFPNNG